MTGSRIYWPDRPLLPVQPQADSRAKERANETGGGFAEILAQRQTVSFSQHALQRLRDRRLDFSETELEKLGDTVNRMAEKGAKESLIYMNDVALIVSIANRTVITAMDGASAKENIFTKIDSAAIL